MTTENQQVVHLENVSLRFRKYYQQGLKETLMRLFTMPAWAKKSGRAESTDFWGLRNVNLTLREGDRLGIIGHNGAGKSTLLKIISRIYRPTTGTVSVDGKIAPLIEIGAGFSPELTGRENAFLNGAILGIPRKSMAEKLSSVIEFSELGEQIDTPVKYYSTGMYLRLALAIATEVTPDILILDELFAGADEGFIEKAETRLEAFIERAKVLILVAHDLGYIRRFCNRVIVMDHGCIAADGRPSEILDKYHAFVRGEHGVFGNRNAGKENEVPLFH